ncbi:MAG: hypothetical protein AB9869_04500 [Verrucomicrobiia bacterium]
MAELPQSEILRRAGRLLQRRSRPRRLGLVTALDTDETYLRMAQVVPRGDRMAVTRTERVHLEWPEGADHSNPGALGAAMAKALQKLDVKPAQVVIGVPRQKVVLRTLALPGVADVREIASMVHMQIAKDLPFKQEEAVIDFVIRKPALGRSPSGSAEGSNTPGASDIASAGEAPKIEVLVAAVKRETVAYYEKAASAAKLKLAALGWLSQGNARCAEACGVAVAEECVALLTLRPDEVGIDIVAGSLLFSRGAVIRPARGEVGDGQVAGQMTPEAPMTELGSVQDREAFVDAVTIELVRNLHSYNGSESHPPVAKLLVAGTTGCEDALVEAVGKRLNLPSSRLNLEMLDLSGPARQHAAEAIGAIGLGLGVNDPDGLPFDFLKPKRPAVQGNARRVRVLASVAAAAVLLTGILGLRSHMIGDRTEVHDAVQKQLAAAEKHVPTYRRMQQQAGAVQKWVKGGRNWLEQLAYLSGVLPGSEDIYVTSISVSGQGVIHLAVQAKSGEILADLQKQLRAAGYELKPLAITPGNDRHGYHFRSTVELLLPPDMKVDLSKAHPRARPADDASLEGTPKRGKGGRS